MTIPEFSRPMRVDTLGERPRAVSIAAEESERAAIARRFGLAAVEQLALDAQVARRGGEIVAEGRVAAEVTQKCVVTGEPVGAAIDEPFALVFRPLPGDSAPDAEIELGEEELDVVFYEGASVDLGEAAAETLALALDPYPRAPGAAEALAAAGVKSEEEAGPFGALAALRDKLKP